MAIFTRFKSPSMPWSPIPKTLPQLQREFVIYWRQRTRETVTYSMINYNLSTHVHYPSTSQNSSNFKWYVFIKVQIWDFFSKFSSVFCIVESTKIISKENHEASYLAEKHSLAVGSEFKLWTLYRSVPYFLCVTGFYQDLTITLRPEPCQLALQWLSMRN